MTKETNPKTDYSSMIEQIQRHTSAIETEFNSKVVNSKRMFTSHHTFCS